MQVLRLIAVSGILAITFLMTGCNTAKGFGEDMQAGGQAIQKAANDTQK